MLNSLTIKNYALIDHLSVNFNSGLTIITGETGAGKSILLGGLSLVLGKRADLSQVKDKSKKCIVEATYDIAKYNLKAFFKSEDLDYEPQTIVRREILPSGKSRGFINDTPVNLDSLQALGAKLLDIHSQHQTLQLTNDDFQFQVIDALADNNKLLEKYVDLLKQFKKISTELELLQIEKSNAIKELDYNAFLLKELQDAKLKTGELESLESEYETLNNVEDIKEKIEFSFEALSNDDVGVIPNLTNVKQFFSKLSSYGQQYKDVFERLSSTLIELDDICSEIELLQNQLEVDPNRLTQVNTKLQVLHNLMQKHTVSTVEDLIKLETDLSHKVIATETIDLHISEKEKVLNQMKTELNTLAVKIHDRRVDTVPDLKSELEPMLQALGMPNARFKIDISKTDLFLSNGCDELDFLFSANKGGEFNTLKKAASGGELSRIMLTIKSILAKYKQLPTIMFDEIDTGVSGEISNRMATIMQEMSKSMQVFTITHLPQIAAKGDTHFKVFKEDIEGKTISQLKQLNSEERIVEIAQMLGGLDVTTSALAHAKELLN